MRKNHTTLIFNLSILTVVLSLAACIFFFKIIQNKNEHTSNVLSTLANKVKEKENTEVLVKKIAEVKVAHEKINSYLVDPTEIDSFVDYLETLGTQANTNVSVKDVQYTPTDKNKILVGISIEGSFNSVVRTIAILENTPYQIHITSSFLNQNEPAEKDPKGGTSGLPSWQADVSFTILSSS